MEMLYSSKQNLHHCGPVVSIFYYNVFYMHPLINKGSRLLKTKIKVYLELQHVLLKSRNFGGYSVKIFFTAVSIKITEKVSLFSHCAYQIQLAKYCENSVVNLS